MKTYPINETFLSLQGEGARAGSLNVFVRFAGCNLTCSRDGEAGFDCDTEFLSSVQKTGEEVVAEVLRLWPPGMRPQVVLTGGEPTLHVDAALLEGLSAVADVHFETNGTREIDRGGCDCWVSCSPKSAEHTLRVGDVDELRYVRRVGQGIPRPTLTADHLYLSPAWSDDPVERRANLDHCVALVRANPEWRLSVQQHKSWGLR